jgi:non-canonical (house-cleaning) NTP pyrophosphatase
MRRPKSAPNRNPKGRKAAGESAFSIGQEASLNEEKFSFLTEQCWYVIENTGRPWKALGRSWNVYENKGDASIGRECH